MAKAVKKVKTLALVGTISIVGLAVAMPPWAGTGQGPGMGNGIMQGQGYGMYGQGMAQGQPMGPGYGMGRGVYANGTMPTGPTSAMALGNVNVQALQQQIMALPKEPLSEDEINCIIHMRQEEKLARDVYKVLYEKWHLPIFANIAASEQTHMDAVKTLIIKYNLTDPVKDENVLDEFEDPNLNELYQQLVAKGEQSEKDALIVGATIEDLDIKDLQDCLAKTDNQDVRIVWENLMKGSEHHLFAFNRMLERMYGENYQCQYITQEECEKIESGQLTFGPIGLNVTNHTAMGMQQGMGNPNAPHYYQQNNTNVTPQGPRGPIMNNPMGAMQNNVPTMQGPRMSPRVMQLIQMVKQNPRQVMEQAMQKLEEARMRARQLILQIKQTGQITPQVLSEVVVLIKDALDAKLQELMAEIQENLDDSEVGQELLNKAADLLSQLETANDPITILNIFKEYKALYEEYQKALQEYQQSLTQLVTALNELTTINETQ